MGDKSGLCVWCGHWAGDAKDVEGMAACYRRDCAGNRWCKCGKLLRDHAERELDDCERMETYLILRNPEDHKRWRDEQDTEM